MSPHRVRRSRIQTHGIRRPGPVRTELNVLQHPESRKEKIKMIKMASFIEHECVEINIWKAKDNLSLKSGCLEL